MIREKDTVIINTSSAEDAQEIKDVSSREVSSKNLNFPGLQQTQGILRSASVSRENSEKSLMVKNKKFDMSSSFFKNLHEISSNRNAQPDYGLNNKNEDLSNSRKNSEVSGIPKMFSENLTHYIQDNK